MDVFDWGGGTMVVEDTSDLPFETQSFDTITFVACLNHIPYRDKAIREAYRLLKPNGQVVMTMINPLLGAIGHAIWWYSEDKRRGGMQEGEVGGMSTRHIVALFDQAGFDLHLHRRFCYKMNHLYVFKMKPERGVRHGPSAGIDSHRYSDRSFNHE